MTLDTWLTFAVLELLLCLTPGPAVLFVTTSTVTRGLRAGLTATAGILASNLMYFVVSATGVAAILLASTTLFEVLRYGGSAYLLFLGLRMLLSKPAPVTDAPTPAVADISLMHGFMEQTLNPKAIAFCVALLPQCVNPAASVAPQNAILTITALVIEASVMLCYIWLSLHLGKRAGTRGQLWFRRTGGLFLILAASRLFLDRS